jgi:Bacterial Ig domain
VAVLYPGFPDSAAAGFGYQLNTTHFLNGIHTVTARVQSATGRITYLNNVDLEFSNTTHDLVPFGKIEFPNPGDEMQGNCISHGFFSVISGYALDAGVADYDTGVGYVELLIDRSLVANSIADCHFDPLQGGYSNCYGIRRLDVETNFPSLKDSPHSGFRFVLDTGLLMSKTDAFGDAQVPPYNPGAHLLTIRSGDIWEQVSIVDEIPVVFSCIDFTQNNNSIGQITFPIQGLLYNGTILVNGWALDLEGVQSVAVLVDGNPVGSANLGFPRPGIRSLYPSYPDSPTPGWVFSLDTTRFSNGQHEISAIVFDRTGADTDIGRFKIVVANPIP